MVMQRFDQIPPRRQFGVTSLADGYSIAIAARKLLSTAMVAAALAASAQNGLSEELPRGSIKPLEGLSFNLGHSKVVSYFTSNGNVCNLVVTAADSADTEDSTLSVSRYEASVRSGAK